MQVGDKEGCQIQKGTCASNSWTDGRILAAPHEIRETPQNICFPKNSLKPGSSDAFWMWQF